MNDAWNVSLKNEEEMKTQGVLGSASPLRENNALFFLFFQFPLPDGIQVDATATCLRTSTSRRLIGPPKNMKRRRKKFTENKTAFVHNWNFVLNQRARAHTNSML